MRSAEHELAEAPLWLDLQRFVADALDRLGADFSAARTAVLQEVGFLLTRVEGLPGLRFEDGTSFADAETRAWLTAAVAPNLRTDLPRPLDPVEASVAAGRAFLEQGSLVDGLALLTKAAGVQYLPVDRFRLRLARAELCLQAEQFVVARAQLVALDELVQRHHLVDWDAGLAASFYAALFRAHRGANILAGGDAPPEARAREIAAFEKLCELDPSAAIQLTNG